MNDLFISNIVQYLFDKYINNNVKSNKDKN